MRKRVLFTLLRKNRSAASILLAVLLASLLAACYTTPTPPPPSTAVPTQQPPENTPPPAGDGTGFTGFELNCEDRRAEEPGQPLETNPFFVEGQVILSGLTQAIQQTLAQIEIELTEEMVCRFVFPEQLRPPDRARQGLEKRSSPEAEKATFPFYNQQTGNFNLPAGTELSMNLYSFDRSQLDLLQVLQAIRQTPAAQEGQVFADPNYLTGHLADTPCGNPFSVEGSPFSVEGSPFSVEGSPYGGASPADPAAYWNQWAFSLINLKPPAERAKERNGEGVRVGIFDTSPYTLTTTISTTQENAVQPALNLTVHHPFRLPALAVSSAITQPLNVSDHGLFAASLIHAVAFESEIHLYRVLDRQGCGDLYQLNIGMLDFVSAGLGENGARQPGVMNLSLGIRKPRELPSDPTERARAEADIAKFDETIQAAYRLISEESSIESLEFVTSLADRAGNIVVAAAGNDSVTGITPLPMELPAAYPYVLGVSATDPNAGPACYSNQGDIAAPGGAAVPDVAGTPDPAGNPVPICRPRTDSCSETDTTGQCEFGVVGLFSHSSTKYAYWVGTSFATPLVSGVAAVYYQTGSPTSVYAQILSQVNSIPDPQFGVGVIQAP